MGSQSLSPEEVVSRKARKVYNEPLIRVLLRELRRCAQPVPTPDLIWALAWDRPNARSQVWKCLRVLESRELVVKETVPVVRRSHRGASRYTLWRAAK